ncbi:hypothetical protein COCC4DRAFT_153090 [Bipolaris maydis ATCC 48331]|uniref:Uncharacterized protein n=2 Tax=Cochliobolus heterostrophus TaxID=5016 RepID=M2SIW2_COCH5|nr:uncharacterized protein COCC4DRAFT_153090 [Bipolaris maydis ATCC 48331]EMD85295.1 hypothetical protein COCHEDRAFT_1035675 [Bipolaris maydis C5]ENH99538.1 hypothetical protein COCC4DRAFT_153090 [Bipolaris maydis ATCC 48331]KAJ6268825.1 hypothetical protein PSV08DRAFT_248938 [Bipolaris maydis]KAJ6279635.1 hypothetical protein J3E71DRAFT_242300 [Bipolaris maydis]
MSFRPLVQKVKKKLAALLTVGRLKHLLKKSPRRKSSVTRSTSPSLATTNDLEVESQQPTLTESRNSVENSSPGAKLELDVLGQILTTILPRPNPYVLGLERAGRAVFAPKTNALVVKRSAGRGSQECLRAS